MKKFDFMWIFSMLMFVAFSFSSCSKDELGSPSDLVGTWEIVKTSGWEKEDGKLVKQWDEMKTADSRVVFNENGTMQNQEFTNGQWETSASETTWEYTKGKLHLLSANGEKEFLTVKKLNSSVLIVEKQENNINPDTNLPREEFEHLEYKKIAK